MKTPRRKNAKQPAKTEPNKAPADKQGDSDRQFIDEVQARINRFTAPYSALVAASPPTVLKHVPLGGTLDESVYPDLVHPTAAANDVVAIVREGVALLRDMAGKDPVAARRLFRLIYDTVRWINFETTRSGLVERLAPESVSWPVLLNPDPKSFAEAKEYVTRLKVGATSGYSIGPRTRWSQTKGGKLPVATQCALDIHRILENNRHQLDLAAAAEKNGGRFDYSQLPQWAKECATLLPLTKATADKWFELGWKAVMEATDGHPEKNQTLRPLGLYREKHYLQNKRRRWKAGQRVMGSSISRPDYVNSAANPARTKEDDILDGIKARLRTALKNMAAP